MTFVIPSDVTGSVLFVLLLNAVSRLQHQCLVKYCVTAPNALRSSRDVSVNAEELLPRDRHGEFDGAARLGRREQHSSHRRSEDNLPTIR